MAQILLNGFNIITGFDGSNGIGMTQIMETGGRGANLRDNDRKVPVYHLRANMLTQLIGKHKSAVCIAASIQQAILQLFEFNIFQQAHDGCRQGNRSGLGLDGIQSLANP